MTEDAATEATPEVARACAIARRLVLFPLLYNGAEAVIAVASGIAASSIALEGLRGGCACD